MKLLFWQILTLTTLSIKVAAGTYYIDWDGGSDANNGISTGTAWKRSPGMVGFAGSYSHAAGDHFIFKGGVTWPRTVLPLTIANSGNSSTPDVYRSTNTWYSGGSFAIPCFDGEHIQLVGSISSPIYVTGDYITISGIEIKRQLVPNSAGFNAYGHGGIRVSAAGSFVTVRECWIHDWLPAVSAATPNNTDSDFGGVVGLSGSSNIVVITNVIGPGLPPVGLTGNSGCGVGGTVLVVSSNRIFGVTECINGGATNISFNYLSYCTNSYDPPYHPNVIYHGLASNGKAWIYGNTIHGIDTEFQTMLLHVGYLGATNTAYYISGNLIYDVSSPIDVDESGIVIANSGTKAYIYNNTISRSITVAALKRNQTYHISLLECKNNLWISDTPTGNPIGTAATTSAYAPVESLVDDNNVWLTSAQAVTAGYTTVNLFQGTSATAGLGDNYYSLVFPRYDVLGRERQSVGDWDIGAYALVGPTISTIPDQSIYKDEATAAIPFTLSDIDDAEADLTLSVESSNTALIQTGDISFGGSGASRTITVTPDAGETGSSTITVTAEDPNGNTGSTEFLIDVTEPIVIPARVGTFVRRR